MSKKLRFTLPLAALAMATQAGAMPAQVPDSYYATMQATYSVIATYRPCNNFIKVVCAPDKFI